MTLFLWIVVGILWTFLVLIVGYGAGVQHMKDKVHNMIDIDGPPGPPGPVGPKGDRGDRGPRGEAAADEAWVVDIVERLKSLEDRDYAYQSRFTRVERKAGLSV